MKLKFSLLLLSLIAIRYTLFPAPVSAHCPLCVAGAVAGVSVTRWIGVDDSITGVWIAALLGAMSFWFSSWLYPKISHKFKSETLLFLKPFVYLIVFASTIWSFYRFNLVIRMSQIFGLDKLTFGMLTGGILFYLADLIKIKHYFNYQRIVISLGSMIILSLAIYVLINYYI